MTTSTRSTPSTRSASMDARMRARRARVRADAVKRRQRRTVSLFVLLLLITGVAVVLRSSLFELSGVSVTGVRGRRAATIERTAALQPGQHLLTAPLVDAQRRVESLPWVKEAVVRRSPPSTVSIEITPRVPVLTVRTGGAAWQVDGDAVLVNGGKVKGAPVVSAPDARLPKPGGTVDVPAVRDAVEVHRNLPAWLRRRVVSYEVDSPNDLVLRLRVPPEDSEGEPTIVPVRFGTARDLALKAEVIRVLLPQAAEQDAALDVRAPANPVVVP